jgi:hypothetical protein
MEDNRSATFHEAGALFIQLDETEMMEFIEEAQKALNDRLQHIIQTRMNEKWMNNQYVNYIQVREYKYTKADKISIEMIHLRVSIAGTMRQLIITIEPYHASLKMTLTGIQGGRKKEIFAPNREKLTEAIGDMGIFTGTGYILYSNILIDIIATCSEIFELNIEESPPERYASRPVSPLSKSERTDEISRVETNIPESLRPRNRRTDVPSPSRGTRMRANSPPATRTIPEAQEEPIRVVKASEPIERTNTPPAEPVAIQRSTSPSSDSANSASSDPDRQKKREFNGDVRIYRARLQGLQVPEEEINRMTFDELAERADASRIDPLYLRTELRELVNPNIYNLIPQRDTGAVFLHRNRERANNLRRILKDRGIKQILINVMPMDELIAYSIQLERVRRSIQGNESLAESYKERLKDRGLIAEDALILMTFTQLESAVNQSG